MSLDIDPAVFGRPNGGENQARRIILTPADDIKSRRVKWLWQDRLAVGILGLLAGREGLGKSSFGYWLAARISRGQLPGEYHNQPRAVLICAAEDSWEQTIKPRLIAAGADLSVFTALQSKTWT
jgi:hypothetical protein